MELSDAELEHLAKLAALSLDDEERIALRTELTAILDYVECLSQAPTAGVKATSQLYEQKAVMRDDINRESLSLERVKNLASEFTHSGFRVPKVL